MNARMKNLMGRTILPAATVAFAAVGIAPAAAQVEDAAILNIMRECGKINDPTSRLACYDNNIRTVGQQPAVPGRSGPVQGGGAVVSSTPGGFGGSSVRTPDRFLGSEERGQGPEQIRARIIDAREREPGMWLVTIEGDAQWVFTDSVPRSFRTPRKGALVEIQRASMGSFLMIVDGQSGVRVRRIK